MVANNLSEIRKEFTNEEQEVFIGLLNDHINIDCT